MIEHLSTKEERDDLLFYKSIDVDRLKRIKLFSIPIDNVNQDEAVACILSSIEKQEHFHVLFVDPLKIIRSRFNKKLKSVANRAGLILPEGGGLLWASRAWKRPLKQRISKISLLMDVLRLAMRNDFTVYLLGTETETVERVFVNLQKSFAGIRIIGRQAGCFGHDRERLVKESLRKSAPNLIFLGMNFPMQELWIRKNASYLSSSVVIGVDDSLTVLSGNKKNIPDYFQLRGLGWLWYTIIQPWALVRVSQVMIFYFVSFLKKIFRFNRSRK